RSTQKGSNLDFCHLTSKRAHKRGRTFDLEKLTCGLPERHFRNDALTLARRNEVGFQNHRGRKRFEIPLPLQDLGARRTVYSHQVTCQSLPGTLKGVKHRLLSLGLEKLTWRVAGTAFPQ